MTKLTRKIVWIWSFAFVLLVCVAATGVVIAGMLGGFMMSDEGAISLIDENAEYSEDLGESGPADDNEEGDPAPESRLPEESSADNGERPSTLPSTSSPIKDPGQQNAGFEASDDKTVWSTNTQVEIFRVSYENGEQVVTVNSDNGEKVIAPGTENSYTFKLKNTGSVPLEYTVEVNAYFTPADVAIPIKGRLNRYDGEWIVGGSDEYADVPTLDTAKDEASLGAGKYTYYTLDWVWLFESGDDAYDTELGNLAVTEDLVFTIEIKTTATETDEGGGITPPQTGEYTALWIALAAGSAGALVLLVVYRKKRIAA